MSPDKVRRSKLNTLTDLPNVGKAVAEDLALLGITQPQDLAGQDAYEMYDRLCSLTATRHDPCMIDIFLSLVDFMRKRTEAVVAFYGTAKSVFSR